MGRFFAGLKKGLFALVAPRYWKRRLPFLLTALILSSLFFIHQGQRYFEGRQVLRDLRNIHNAGEWYRYGADRDVKEAQYNLGLLYHRGFTVPKDDAEAARWMRKASDHDLALAQNELGTYYEAGIGVQKDPAEAAKLYQRAADQGLLTAMNHLAGLLMTGNGIKEDKAAALKWFEKSASQGFIPAQLNLAIAYERGNGAPADAVRAYSWISVADTATDQTEYQTPIDQISARLMNSMDEPTRLKARGMAKLYIDQYGPKTRDQFINILKQQKADEANSSSRP